MYEVRVIHQAGNYEACRKNHRGSRGMRDYSEKDLINFANNNPGMAVYLKPRRHQSPCIKAEYINGGEEYINTHDLNGEELVAKWVEYMRGRSGYPVERLLKYQHTDSFLSVIGCGIDNQRIPYGSVSQTPPPLSLIMQLPVQLQMASPAAKEWLQKRRDNI
ncbi:large ribosomal subunit protein mL43-like isoform X2 [Oratosquilla oratoria]|uniref:large ribosomal subunit protein mL43-like isoform X2 n=1 Tax=Oratosquilla oratoria TaxID=337810 RepID=UPI003F75770E